MRVTAGVGREMTTRKTNPGNAASLPNLRNLTAFLVGQVIPWVVIYLLFVIGPIVQGRSRFTLEHVAVFTLICGVSTIAAWFTAVVIHEVMPRRLLYQGWRRTGLAFTFGMSAGLAEVIVNIILKDFVSGPLRGSVLLAGSSCLATTVILMLLCRGFKRGRCPRCDYDLRASTRFGRCPECGLGIAGP